MAVTDEQRQQVRRALSEAGAKQDTVGAFKDGDLDVLFSNGWDTRAFLLNAQEKHLVACGLSLGAVGVIMRLQEGEPSFLMHCTVNLHGEIVTSYLLTKKSWISFEETIKRVPCIPI